MKFPDELFLLSLIALALFFQIGMWRELRQGRGRSFYPLGLTFCCVMEALCFHNLLSVYAQSVALAISGSIFGALACVAAAYGMARIRDGRK
jgi:ABC-type spermidine/putrescine transport system permease subunit II